MDGNFNIGRWQGRRALLNQRVTRLRWFSGNVEPSFITIALQERLSELHGSKAYTTVQHLSGKQMEDALIPLPPLAEQHRIVARVDELMGLLDRLEADRNTRDELRRAARDAALADLRNAPDPEAVETAWTRIAQQMDDLFIEPEDVAPLRQAVLELAVLGRLTGDDVGSWSPTCLGDLLVDGPTNGWSPKAVDYPTPVKSLKLSATTRGYFDSEQYKYVDPSGGIDDRLWLKPGDLLIQRSNTPEYVGTAAVYDGPLRTFIYPDLMMRCRFAPTVDVAFIHVALSAPACRTWVSAKASGTSKSMVKINQSTVRSIPLSLPPKAKQIEIVESVRRLHELCDRLMVRLTSSRVLQAQFAGAAVHHLHI
ncbi:MAG: restriction endonuclease subunit S, partial [Myxococcales bacterium]|nr:restriction endonuclease subunit S [Myxococcales bacterium]